MANIRIAASVSKKLRLFGTDARGVAAIEFAITGLLLVIGLLNAVDVGFYVYRRMEVENAAEVGAQAAWQTCHDENGDLLPATQNNVSSGLPNCPGLNAAITTAIQSTSLGTAVSLDPTINPNPAEDYRCADASNVLQSVGPVTSPEPANCAAAGNAAATPGDYLQVGVTWPYQPLFPFSVMRAFSVTKTTWMRMG